MDFGLEYLVTTSDLAWRTDIRSNIKGVLPLCRDSFFLQQSFPIIVAAAWVGKFLFAVAGGQVFVVLAK